MSKNDDFWPSDKWELPDNNKWEVDLIKWWDRPVSQLDHPMRVITQAAKYRYKKWGSNNLYNIEAAELTDFIIELVHEIERLQEELIDCHDQIEQMAVTMVSVFDPPTNPPYPHDDFSMGYT